MKQAKNDHPTVPTLLWILACLTALSVHGAQQSPALDPNIRAVITRSGGLVSALAVQTDGKILLAGGFNAVNGTPRNGLVRLNGDGSVDPAFDVGSLCCGAQGNPNQAAAPITALLVQPDGNIVIGGYFTNVAGVARTGLARLTATGTVDTSFDPGTGLGLNGGFQSIPPVVQFVLQPDGRLLVGGYYTTINGVTRNGVARLNANGSVDTTFNPGSALAIGDPIDAARLTGLALVGNGQIIVAGNIQSFNAVPRAGIARLNGDGTLDPAFDPNIGQQDSAPAIGSLLVQSDGRMVISGSFDVIDFQFVPGLARMKADGTVDSTFSSNADPSSESYTLLALQPADGKIIAYHQFTDAAGNPRQALARLNTDGSVDPTFNFDLQPGEGTGLQVANVAFQADGRLLVGGNFYADTNHVHQAVARLDATGHLDASLAPRFETAEGQGANVLSVAVQADNKVLFGGTFQLVNGVPRTGLARLNQDGTLDTAFAPVIDMSPPQSAVFALLTQTNGQILIGGVFASVNGTNRSGLALLNQDGTLDPTFDVGSGTGDSGRVLALAGQTNGQVLVAGDFTQFNGVALPAVVRLNTNGSTDLSFSVGFSSCADCGASLVRGIGALTNNAVMISGAFSRIQAINLNGVARLQPSGLVDFNFSPPITTDEQVTAMVVSTNSNDTIVAIQFADPSGNGNRSRFLRFNPDGTVDSSYHGAEVGGDGSGAAPVAAMALDSQDRLIIAGQFTTVGGAPRFGLARLNADGSLDSSFDAGPGFASGVFHPSSNSSGLISSVAVQPAGGVAVGGNFAVVDNEVRLGLALFDATGPNQGGGSSNVMIQSPARAADGSFSMLISGQTGVTYQVQASSDLRSWTTLGTVTGAATPQSFSDPGAKGLAMRFYRVSGP